VASPSGRVAVVTGAARGIGAAIASRLASGGASVAVLDIDGAGAARTAARIANAGAAALAVEADVADELGVAAAIDRVTSELGAPSILVNNAGAVRESPLEGIRRGDWDVVLDVSLRGAMLMCQAVRPHLVAGGWGRIVNISSTSAHGSRDQASYASAKAGVQGLTRTLAIELGPHGTTVNAIAPGFIATDMTAAMAARLGLKPADFEQIAAGQTPVRRVGTPGDIAYAVAFLAGDRASYITGQVLYVTGGVVR
jgi:3-oxoacyl-[acyl-carrier protein] reductase